MDTLECVHMGSRNIRPRSLLILSARTASGADRTLAREHGLDVAGQTDVPLYICTLDVDYRDIDVQVGKELTAIGFLGAKHARRNIKSEKSRLCRSLPVNSRNSRCGYLSSLSIEPPFDVAFFANADYFTCRTTVSYSLAECTLC